MNTNQRENIDAADVKRKVMVPFFIFYLFVPFFITLRPLKKYRDAVTLQQKLTKPEILSPVTESELEENGPFINKDVFNQIKSKRKIITEEESARTKAFADDGRYGKVETDTISRNLLKEKTASFSLKNNNLSSSSTDKGKDRNSFFDSMSDD